MIMFEKRLKEIRKEKNYSQEEIGRAIFVSKQEVCLYESGKRMPPLEVLVKLANFLEVDLLWLIGMELKVPLKENRIVNLSEDDIKIINSLKKDKALYSKFLEDPDRTISEINSKINK